MALILLASIHPCKCFSNTCKQNGCHTQLVGDYSITSKLTRASECDVVLERYCICNKDPDQLWKWARLKNSCRTFTLTIKVGSVKPTPPIDGFIPMQRHSLDYIHGLCVIINYDNAKFNHFNLACQS